jgi:hypothetical protein
MQTPGVISMIRTKVVNVTSIYLKLHMVQSVSRLRVPSHGVRCRVAQKIRTNVPDQRVAPSFSDEKQYHHFPHPDVNRIWYHNPAFSPFCKETSSLQNFSGWNFVILGFFCVLHAPSIECLIFYCPIKYVVKKRNCKLRLMYISPYLDVLTIGSITCASRHIIRNKKSNLGYSFVYVSHHAEAMIYVLDITGW